MKPIEFKSIDWNRPACTDQVRKASSYFETHEHNTMRFDIALGHFYGLVADGDITAEELATKIREAIVEAVNRATNWKHEDAVVRPSGLLHDEVITYDFS
jgi:hypothetical protein